MSRLSFFSFLVFCFFLKKKCRNLPLSVFLVCLPFRIFFVCSVVLNFFVLIFMLLLLLLLFDDFLGNGQWDTGRTAMLAHATGIAPSKDNFWSTQFQPGTHYDGGHANEPYSRLQAASIITTGGPVAPSDKIGYSNKELIMSLCTKDGTLLTPDRPATDIDAYFTFQAFGKGVNGHIFSTYSQLSEDAVVTYVTAVNLVEDYNVSIAEIGYKESTVLLAFEQNSTNVVQKVDASHPLTAKACGQFDFQFYTLAPILSNGMALLGEPSKWISVSRARFQSISYDETSITAEVLGSAGEDVTVHFTSSSSSIFAVSCTLPESGRAQFVGQDSGTGKCIWSN